MWDNKKEEKKNSQHNNNNSIRIDRYGNKIMARSERLEKRVKS